MPKVLDTQPINRNFLSQLEFRLVVKRMPAVNFFLQRINIPQINLPPIQQPNPFVEIPHAGDHIVFGPLGVEFKVDEDFMNYREISEWITKLGYPQDFAQYKSILDEEKNPISGKGLRSDLALVILSSVKKPNWEIVFHDAFPTSLSGLQFDTTSMNVEYLSALATFSYSYYTFEQF